jgi:hypothetical protein
MMFEKAKRRRSLLLATLMSGILLCSAPALAIEIYFGAPSPAGPLDAGEQVVVPLFLDTEGETNIDGVFVSVVADPSLLMFVSGTSPTNILLNFSIFEGLARVREPFELVLDDLGYVRSSSFVINSLGGSGVSSSAELLATLTFEAVDGVGGDTTIAAVSNFGDMISVDYVDVSPTVTYGSSANIHVNPEPAFAMQIAIGTLFVAMRRGRRSVAVQA